jgi:hypothetical protein
MFLFFDNNGNDDDNDNDDDDDEDDEDVPFNTNFSFSLVNSVSCKLAISVVDIYNNDFFDINDEVLNVNALLH